MSTILFASQGVLVGVICGAITAAMCHLVLTWLNVN